MAHSGGATDFLAFESRKFHIGGQKDEKRTNILCRRRPNFGIADIAILRPARKRRRSRARVGPSRSRPKRRKNANAKPESATASDAKPSWRARRHATARRSAKRTIDGRNSDAEPYDAATACDA